jgi:transcriptional regulator with XRE-family HTH domain
MDKSGKHPYSGELDGFPARLRQVVDSYGSTSALARVIQRSEGAVRKWLRGESEPTVSDLRGICDLTGTSAEWLVMGRGERYSGGTEVREPYTPYGAEPPLPPLSYSLMDDVVTTVDAQSKATGTEVVPAKRSSVLTTVYNMSRTTRRVDPEAVARIIGLTS